MDDFDPVPKLNPAAKGLLSAVLLVVIGLATYGAIALTVAILVGAGR